MPILIVYYFILLIQRFVRLPKTFVIFDQSYPRFSGYRGLEGFCSLIYPMGNLQSKDDFLPPKGRLFQVDFRASSLSSFK